MHGDDAALLSNYFKHLFKLNFLTEHLYLNRCVATMCCKSARHWLTALPWQLHTDIRWACRPHPVGHDGVGHDNSCVSDVITHDDLPNTGR